MGKNSNHLNGGDHFRRMKQDQDIEDIAIFDQRSNEPLVIYKEMLKKIENK